MASANNSTARTTSHVGMAKPADESIKETFESIVIAFILAFVFRAYVVEAFIIPTGSMAPTLLGAHVRETCQQCGYTYLMGYDAGASRQAVIGVCPMCRFPQEQPIGTLARAGDRILVQKYGYLLSDPRRWDVVVFKEPANPRTNFIKRLVGLPGESIRLFDGNVFYRKGDDKWQIARKTDPATNPHWESIQRAVWQPIYHTRYLPVDGGDSPTRQQMNLVWRVPWVTDDEPKRWEIDGRRSYVAHGDTPATIRFDFGRAGHSDVMQMYPYNQAMSRTRRPGLISPIEDIRLALSVRPDDAPANLTLATTCRFDNPAVRAERLTATIASDGSVSIERTPSQGSAPIVLASAAPGTATLAAAKTTDVELWVVDQQVLVWVDGQVVVRYGWDVPMEVTSRLPPPRMTPRVSIQVSGASQTEMFDIQLDRDLYYLSDRMGTLGALYRKPTGPAMPGRVLELDEGEFFVLGDNSPASSDGRYWSKVNPWIALDAFGGKQRLGVVPESLMIGRAFMVYYPAPFRIVENRMGVIPNFGDMRFIH